MMVATYLTRRNGRYHFRIRELTSPIRGRVSPPPSCFSHSRDDRPARFRRGYRLVVEDSAAASARARPSVGPLDAEIDDLDQLALDG